MRRAPRAFQRSGPAASSRIPRSRSRASGSPFPRHWPLIGGMDFGWDHPFAAVELVQDRDTDIVYVTKAYRIRQSTPVIHAAALRPWGKIPWAWPRDGAGRHWRARASPCGAIPQARARYVSHHAQFETEVNQRRGRHDGHAHRMEAGASRFSSIKPNGSTSIASTTARTAGSSRKTTTSCQPRAMA